MLSLLWFADSYSGGKGAGDLSLSFEAIEALGFLIAGSVDRNRYVCRRRTTKSDKIYDSKWSACLIILYICRKHKDCFRLLYTISFKVKYVSLLQKCQETSRNRLNAAIATAVWLFKGTFITIPSEMTCKSSKLCNFNSNGLKGQCHLPQTLVCVPVICQNLKSFNVSHYENFLFVIHIIFLVSKYDRLILKKSVQNLKLR